MSQTTYTFGSFRLDTARRLLFSGDEITPLPERAFQLLLLLIEAAGEVVSKETLAARVWPESTVSDANLSQHVYLLRRMLREKATDRSYIMTVSRRGFRFAAPITAAATDQTPTPIEVRRATAPVPITRGTARPIHFGNTAAEASCSSVVPRRSCGRPSKRSRMPSASTIRRHFLSSGSPAVTRCSQSLDTCPLSWLSRKCDWRSDKPSTSIPVRPPLMRYSPKRCCSATGIGAARVGRRITPFGWTLARRSSARTRYVFTSASENTRWLRPKPNTR